MGSSLIGIEKPYCFDSISDKRVVFNNKFYRFDGGYLYKEYDDIPLFMLDGEFLVRLDDRSLVKPERSQYGSSEIEEEIYIPDGEAFDLDCSINYENDSFFTKNGSVSWSWYGEGSYKRYGNIIMMKLTDMNNRRDTCIFWYGVYNHKLYHDVYSTRKYLNTIIDLDVIIRNKNIHREDASRRDYSLGDYERTNSFERTKTQAVSAHAPWESTYFSHACPYCGMKTVRLATWDDKRLSVAFWGVVASPKTGKRFKCDSCKRMW